MEAEEQETVMSYDEMQDYWQTLCSFSGEDIPNSIDGKNSLSKIFVQVLCCK